MAEGGTRNVDGVHARVVVVALVANSVQAGDGLLVDVPNALELIHFQTARGEVEHITHAG